MLIKGKKDLLASGALPWPSRTIGKSDGLFMFWVCPHFSLWPSLITLWITTLMTGISSKTQCMLYLEGLSLYSECSALCILLWLERRLSSIVFYLGTDGLLSLKWPMLLILFTLSLWICNPTIKTMGSSQVGLLFLLLVWHTFCLYLHSLSSSLLSLNFPSLT